MSPSPNQPPTKGNWAATVLSLAAQAGSERAFLAELFVPANIPTGGDLLQLIAAEGGTFVTVATTGTTQPVPRELCAEACDAERVTAAEGWLIAPLGTKDGVTHVLAFHLSVTGRLSDKVDATSITALAATFNEAWQLVRTIDRQRQRAAHLAALVPIIEEWATTQETAALLNRMAEASTKLLAADRASIFLWDKPNKLLIGRPALGVPGGELAVPDDAGVVGEVLRSGEPRRVRKDETNSVVNRTVDKATGYQTASLLAVPMRGSDGELMGVFEVLNKRQGEFTADDETLLSELADHAAFALENTQARERAQLAQRVMTDQAAADARLIGNSPAIEQLRATVRRVADTELAVLVLGENGTGKEVVSQSLHYQSRRRNKPLVSVNCAAMAETLLESELFGHEKGAFTDAHEARAGKFELATGGTLFLDEVGDLSLAGQAKLLRVLEEKIIVRVGGSRSIAVDVRVIAATNQDLAAMVRAKKFREDLFFRLNVVVLDLSPLRDRGDDVLLLAEHFLAEFSRRAKRKSLKLAAEARKRLVQHAWPGNVRELRNLMERLAYLAPGERIEVADVAFISAPASDDANLLSIDQPLSSATDRFQIEYIRRAIDRCRGNMTDAADLLGLHRSNLYRKMKQLGMEE